MVTNDSPPSQPNPNLTDDELRPETVAERLGLVDGEFRVERSDGTSETGWVVEEEIDVREKETDSDKETDKIVSAVIIGRDYTDESGEKFRLQKVVSVEQLLGWQVPSDESNAVEIKDDSLSLQEEELKKRLEVLFAPPRIAGETQDSATSQPEAINYDHLFSKDYVKPDYSHLQAIPGVPEKKTIHLKHEDVVQAGYELRKIKHNPDIKTMLDQHKGELYKDEDLVGLFRKDAQLRLKIGTLVIDLLDSHKIPYLGRRVIFDDMKTPNHTNYEEIGKIRSREYVAKLVLSMLDGTFDIAKSNSDPVDDDSIGDGLGQHRFSARKVLDYLNKPYEY